MSASFSLLVGVGAGYNFALATEKEAEIRKGQGYYLSSILQASQIAQLSTVAGELTNGIPNIYLRVGTKAAITATSLAAWGVCPIFAATKQGHLEEGIKAIKSIVQVKFPRAAKILPDTLNQEVETAFSYLAENIGFFAQVSMIAGTMALPLVGSPYLAVGALSPLVYQAIDLRGFVPRKMSLIVETYMPAIATNGAILGGGLVAQVLAAYNTLSYFPAVNIFMHQKIDKFSKRYFDLEGPSIEEIDAPVSVNRQLSITQINKILDTTNSNKFAVNPAHCSKSIWLLKELPKSFEFSQLLDFCEKIKWEDKYSLLKPPFSDDERFINYLKSQFKGKVNIQDRFDYYLDIHAKKMNTTKEKFLANQLKKQMIELVKMLTGERRPEGSQKDSDEAIHYCAQILAYLQKLNLEDPFDLVTLEDYLSKLGVEGGEYCARAVKRASKEIVNGILQQLSDGESDPLKDYERQLQVVLEATRKKMVDAYYQEFISVVTSGLKSDPLGDPSKEVTDKLAVSVAQNVHILDLYYTSLALGVIPLSNYERKSMGLNELFLWSSPTNPFRMFRNLIYNNYYLTIHDAIHELGHLYFSDYLIAIINQNSTLDQAQKEAVIEKFTECNDEQWSVKSTQERFNRLVCVMLGILNYEFIQDDWEEIDQTELEPLDLPDFVHKSDEEWELV